jgi:prepilin-type N-terminal cleavage/methylation domain
MQLNSRGFSLVELLIAMTIGLMVAAIIASLFVSIIRANSTTVQLAKLNQDLQATVDIIARDIQRAGYNNNAAWNLARDTNGNHVNASGALATIDQDAMFSAFITSGGVSTLRDVQCLNAAGVQQATASSCSGGVSPPNVYNCILLHYDANGDGVISGTDEIIGYRRLPVNNAAVQSKSWANLPAVGDRPCEDTGWTDLAGNDGTLNINSLTFTLLPASGASATSRQRSILIDIVGQSVRNAGLSVTLEREVRLRNDQF